MSASVRKSNKYLLSTNPTYPQNTPLASIPANVNGLTTNGLLTQRTKLLLKAAGARDDLSVRATCSDPTGMPGRLVTARLKFSTLALPGSPPMAGEKANPDKPPVPVMGEWRSVKFAQRSPRELEGGDCELVEQFDRELLPYFTVRNRKEHMSCTPHQVSAFGIDLPFEALAAPKVATPAKP